jgi:hypothetical protein
MLSTYLKEKIWSAAIVVDAEDEGAVVPVHVVVGAFGR